MRAEDVRGGLLESGEIEWEPARPDIGREHRRADAVTGKNPVFVGFATSAMTGVEVCPYGFDGQSQEKVWAQPNPSSPIRPAV